MHDTNTGSPLPLSSTHQGDSVTLLSPSTDKAAQKTASAQSMHKPAGIVQRVLHFFVKLFSRKEAVRARKLVALSLAERAAAARAAQMSPPVAFIGDTTNTLITPMGAYAGKPVDQAIRRRAEQQFKNMDITQATIN